MFKSDDIDAINRFNCYFIAPFFAFQFASHINPYQMNMRFICADIISKAIIIVILLLWANCTSKGNYSWAVTCFSLCTLSNTLVVGVPLLGAMYNQVGADLVVQSFVMQSLVWFICLLFLLELHRARSNFSSKLVNNIVPNNNGDQGNFSIEVQENDERPLETNNKATPPFLYLMKTVTLELVCNPNCFSCIIGITWALIANRWHISMPSIIEGSILIFSKAGAGVAMFSMGLFIALQDKFISCGVYVMLFGLVMRFVVGPLAMTIGSVAMGLQGDVLHVSILQAALPQALTAFVFAKEYGLHATVLSTEVLFGTFLSLPILIAYFDSSRGSTLRQKRESKMSNKSTRHMYSLVICSEI
ncbi:hypothetical protein Leryth_003061 [Lithospermum erythrorhizon]|nr:hypothetical protein Leryth_003061 [Lithospermum erythrorhizon]